MRVLVGKTFGLGNAVMAIPALKAMHLAGHQVDVLVGNTADDVGAHYVMSQLRQNHGVVENVYVNEAPGKYDVAVMSIPFDGRWRNNTHFRAQRVVDCRTRPDPATSGLVSWKKHEVEYQMENAFELGYSGEVPPQCFITTEMPDRYRNRYFFGVGYKKDEAGFWKVKHWGNENFAGLARLILDADPANEVVMTGDLLDLHMTIGPIMREVGGDRVRYCGSNLHSSVIEMLSCGTYVGNDTGMMHVAAAHNLETHGLFFMKNASVKNRPWSLMGHVVDGVDRKVTPEEVFSCLT